MSTGTYAKELFKKGKVLNELGLELEECREKLNSLSHERSLSDPLMLELEARFDKLLLTYMKAEEEAKRKYQSMNELKK